MPIDGPSDEEDAPRTGRLTVHELEEEEHLMLLHLPSSQPDEVEEPAAFPREGQRRPPEVVDLVEEEEEEEEEEKEEEAKKEDAEVVVLEAAAGKEEGGKLSDKASIHLVE